MMRTTVNDKRKQSLYFPDDVLQEILEFAGAGTKAGGKRRQILGGGSAEFFDG